MKEVKSNGLKEIISQAIEKMKNQRRRDARRSVIMATVWLLLSACVLLYLRHLYVPEGIWSTVMLIASLLELGMIIPVWILLKTRLKWSRCCKDNMVDEPLYIV